TAMRATRSCASTLRGCRSRPRSAILSAISIWPWRRSASPSWRKTRLPGSRASSSLQRRMSSAIGFLREQPLESGERIENGADALGGMIIRRGSEDMLPARARRGQIAHARRREAEVRMQAWRERIFLERPAQLFGGFLVFPRASERARFGPARLDARRVV